jgi:hypothetical protein
VFVLIILWREDFNQLGSFRDQPLHAMPVNGGWHYDCLLASTPHS